MRNVYGLISNLDRFGSFLMPVGNLLKMLNRDTVISFDKTLNYDYLFLLAHCVLLYYSCEITSITLI